MRESTSPLELANSKSRKYKERTSPNAEMLARVSKRMSDLAPLTALNMKSKDKHNHRYPLEIKITAVNMYATGTYSLSQIAAMLGVKSKDTIHRWAHEPVGDGEEMLSLGRKDVAERIRNDLSSRSYMVASKVIGAISEEDIEKASLVQKTTAAATLIDKARLMDDQSTDNIAVLNKNTNIYDDELKNIMSGIDKLKEEIRETERDNNA